MKNLILLLSVLVVSTVMATATYSTEDKVSESNVLRYDDSFIFVENGITFSVYPDGEFDFYIDEQVAGRRNGVTFNSGYDYSPFTQYDDYGAVIQVENVPIYYDYYGRVTQIGDVDISYNRNRVQRVGGMYVYYNGRGFYDYHTGYINVYNRHYVYRPFHAFFSRPALGLCLVYNRPYRRYYSPVRYTYYHPYRHNVRKAYAKIGHTHRYNKIRSERSKIYRNDQRVAVRENAVRSNRSVAKKGNSVARSNRSTAQRKNSVGTDHGRSINGSIATRSNNNGRSISRSSNTARAAERKNTAVRKTVTETPRRSTVTQSARSNKSPQRSTSNRSVRQVPSRSGASATPSSSRSFGKVPSRSRSSAATRSSSSGSRSSVSSKSSSSPSTVSRAPSRSRSSAATRSSSSRSSGRN